MNTKPVVDPVDLDAASTGRLHPGRRGTNYWVLAVCGKKVYLHRLIMERIIGRPLSHAEQVDHINGDGLDHRRINLRLATHADNQRNRQRRHDNSSGYKGVGKHKGKWRAYLTFHGKYIHLGEFGSPEDAARAYDVGARKYFGEFARPNFNEQLTEKSIL